MTEYIFEHSKGIVIVTYTKGGKLKAVKAKRGILPLLGLGEHVPELEKDIKPDGYLQPLKQTGKDDFFTKAQKAWHEFYAERSSLEYRFTAADGGALKQIGKHLTSISGGSAEALAAWEYILHNWNQLDPFYRNNADLKFINSQLNKILNLLKNGKQTGKATTGSDADDLRRRFQS